MKNAIAACLICAGLASPSVLAQALGAAPPQDPISEYILPPELILQHHKAIRLSDAQRNAVFAEVKKTQGLMIDAQWNLQQAMERLVELLRQDKPDEQQVIAQLDNVLGVERDIKRAHVGLAARLKNLLTTEQQRSLRELRAGRPAPGR